MINGNVQTKGWTRRALDFALLIEPKAQRAFNKEVYFGAGDSHWRTKKLILFIFNCYVLDALKNKILQNINNKYVILKKESKSNIDQFNRLINTLPASAPGFSLIYLVTILINLKKLNIFLLNDRLY